jgi:hypothetical protein
MPRLGRSKRLHQLLPQIWNVYDQSSARDYVVRPAVPILFFGNSKRYFASPLKVITVGLNPSHAEFPSDDRFSRFPTIAEMELDSAQREGSRYLAALNAYFCTNPYKGWFRSFEPILKGLDSGYYGHSSNTALHTDLCSPIATSPTWSKLSNEQRSFLEYEGLTLWHSLVKALIPDLIIVSIAERYLQQIKFRPLAARQVIWRLDRQRPYEVIGTLIEIEPSKVSLLVFGRAAQKPFGKVSNLKKAEMGAAIKEWHHGVSR